MHCTGISQAFPIRTANIHTSPPPYVSIQLAVRIEIIAQKFLMHFQCVPLISTLANDNCVVGLKRGFLTDIKECVWTVLIQHGDKFGAEFRKGQYLDQFYFWYS